MILQQTYSTPLLPVDDRNMSSYMNVLTPPSSNEDSPQPVYFVASPNSSSFHAPEDYGTSQIPFDIIPQSQSLVDPNTLLNSLSKAKLEFVEQPTDRFRFRYKSEMAGTHGSLTGMNSDKSRKQTYPTVELKNCTGRAIIRCSIYQVNAHEMDFMPHAHRLIMKKGKEEMDDPHDLVVGPEEGYRATFHGMGIIHTAKKNVVSELVKKKTQLREEYVARVEGKRRELTIKEQVEIKGLAEGESKSINLNIVCLRFDAFIEQNGILFPICEPIYSHGINNLKSALTGDLKIVRLDHVTSPANGGKEVFVLVERVTKRNIKIRFFELNDKDDEVWTGEGKFNDLDVHHQYAIVFKTPAYKDEDITRPVKVFMELFRPSDQAKSEPREFTYMPVKKLKPGSKRPRYENYSSSSYNSSSVASDELPAVVTNLNLSSAPPAVVPPPPDVAAQLLSSWNPVDLSAELQTAITNIDSDEFRRLFDQFGDTDEYPSMAVDAPRAVGLRQALPRTQGDFSRPVVVRQRPVIKLEVSETDRLAACRAYDELLSFSKTTHKPQVAVQILRHWLDTEEKTNALHVFVCQNNVEATGFILKLISLRGLFDLVNVKNADGETPLHLAVKCQNEILVKYLLACRAKVGVVNSNMNTCLHTAVEENAPIKIVEMLLANRDHEKVTSYIDMDNREGNTALLAAVEHKNLSAIKLLCLNGADINKRNLKTGFAPLRVAIEKQHLDIIKYIMWVPKMDPMTEDFRNISPLRAAHNRECSKEILEVIERYMTEKNLEVDIKEEVEDDSDEEIDDESEIKVEMMSPQELEELYKNVTTFTPQCLEEVASILNESGKWEDLADLLDLSHIIRCGIISRDSDVSKYLLRFAVETHNDTLWEIRSFLENLDEARAVEAMDRMVQNMQ